MGDNLNVTDLDALKTMYSALEEFSSTVNEQATQFMKAGVAVKDIMGSDVISAAYFRQMEDTFKGMQRAYKNALEAVTLLKKDIDFIETHFIDELKGGRPSGC